MEQLIHVKRALLIIGTAFLLACGGGGGSAGGVNNTGPALLTADNDDAFGTLALEGSATSKNANPFARSYVGGGTTYSKKYLSLLEQLAGRFQQDIDVALSQNQDSVSLAMVGKQVNPVVSCGGSVAVSTGSVVYSNYCVGNGTFNITFNGSMSYSHENLGGEDFRINLSFIDFSVTLKDGVDTWTQTMSGSMTFLFQGGEFSLTFTSSFERDGKTYKIENLSLTNGEISARLYHPDYGYVDISTDSSDPFVLFDNQFCGGTLIITGVDTAGAQVSSRMVVADDCLSYTISYASDEAVFVEW